MSIIRSLRCIWSIDLKQAAACKKGRDVMPWVDDVDDVDEFMSCFLLVKCNWTRLLHNYEIFMNYMQLQLQFGIVSQNPTPKMKEKGAALIWHKIVSIIIRLSIADGCVCYSVVVVSSQRLLTSRNCPLIELWSITFWQGQIGHAIFLCQQQQKQQQQQSCENVSPFVIPLNCVGNIFKLII